MVTAGYSAHNIENPNFDVPKENDFMLKIPKQMLKVVQLLRFRKGAVFVLLFL